MAADWTEDTSLSRDEIEVLAALDFEPQPFGRVRSGDDRPDRRPDRAARSVRSGPGGRTEPRPEAARPSVRLVVIATLIGLLLLGSGSIELLPALVAAAVGAATLRLVAGSRRARDPRR